MLRSEVLDYTSKNRYNVSFFEDDTIETVRQQIGNTLQIHPDRLFILVGLQLPSDYYTSDPRRWEALFNRISYNGEPITKDIFEKYQSEYHLPNTSVQFVSYDKPTWMSYPPELKPIYEPISEFVEYRIFGTEEEKSYILPLNFENNRSSKILSAMLPNPKNKTLYSTLYDHRKVIRFLIRPYDEVAEQSILVYFPYMTPQTPNRLSDESIRLLNKNSELLSGLLKLPAPKPESITISKIKFYIPWVETDFGSAISTRFEQLFYGLTLSKEIPYIGFFTSEKEVTRHKFYVEDPNNKKPFVDIQIWKAWWAPTKPFRDIPTLLLYRGTSKNEFDRVAITDRDMVINSYRDSGNTETIEDLKESIFKWISTFDAIIPFLTQTDLNFQRWELQELDFSANYDNSLEKFDLLRFQCISNVFDISDKTKSEFKLLRTDYENYGLSTTDIKIIKILRENIGTDYSKINSKIAEELSVTIPQAYKLIEIIQSKIEDNPKLLEKDFRGYPTLELKPKSINVSSVNNLEFPLKYANILRYILSNPKSDELDKLCPRKAQKSDIYVQPEYEAEDDTETDPDLEAYLKQFEEEPLEKQQTTPEEFPTISTEKEQRSIYSYFKNRLQEFDPDTFNFPGSTYPKQCQQPYQPIIMSENDLKRVSNTKYDPRKYLEKSKIIDLENPDGKVICPEYWCMRDQIPLQESQLEVTKDGLKRCPECKGKLQTKASDDPKEFPLISREFLYPGFKNYKSPINGKNLPCCYKTDQSRKNKEIEEDTDDKYYILGENKTDIEEFRNAFLSEKLINGLKINEKYEFFDKGRRLASNTSGFFRVGLGRPSENLSTFLNINITLPSPKDAIETVLKCSFLRTWNKPSDTHVSTISNKLKSITSIEKDDIVIENLSKLISGIDDAYHRKELSLIEDLEYTALTLQCDVFRIFLNSNTLGCMFYSKIVKPRSRGIVILQTDVELDILAYVVRNKKIMNYNVNIFERPFKKETYMELESLRNTACLTDIPSYETALKVMSQISTDDYSVILDPYLRGQAFYVPEKIILPFSPTPLPTIAQPKLSGYSEVTKLPSHDKVLEYLKIAQKTAVGYKWVEDLGNNLGETVEVLTQSGLRIPVLPIKNNKVEQLEVIETIRDIGEANLVFGKHSEELKKTYNEISYQSEVYEFLLFQLTKDLESDYLQLRKELQEIRPNQLKVEPLFKQWFEETTQFVNIENPHKFLSKIRTPCGQFKDEKSCSGNMCGWDGKVCRIQIKKTVKKELLYHRLLSTILENSKIRSMILDGRTTAFFSTILYLELPHELILTDAEL